MQYIWCTKELNLTIEPSDQANRWVDSSYTVHPDMQCGIIMTLGKGVAYPASCKQKINTKSSMEAELVPMDDSIAQVL